MIWVVDVGAARRALLRGRLRCPQPECGGVLRSWASARARSIRVPGGFEVGLAPDRVRCGTCGVTHVVLPAFYVPRRAYSAEVIGAALLGNVGGHGHRQIAAGLAVPAATVRGWLRGLRRGARVLISHAAAVAASAGVGLFDARSPASWHGTELAEALDALAVAARSFSRPADRPPPARPARPGSTGIDYLGLLAAHHRRQIEDRLHVADPDCGLATLPTWHLLNVITAGRLLTAAPSG